MKKEVVSQYFVTDCSTGTFVLHFAKFLKRPFCRTTPVAISVHSKTYSLCLCVFYVLICLWLFTANLTQRKLQKLPMLKALFVPRLKERPE